MAPASSPAMLPDAPEAPLAAVLRAVAAELDLIVELGERTQSALSPLLLEGRGTMGGQELDALVQHAHGLGAFVAALARACPSGWEASPGDAAQTLRLHAQKLRLCGLAHASEPPSAPGVFELL